jgi:hypothetical protein
VPTNVTVEAAGNLCITDTGNQRIRKVSAARAVFRARLWHLNNAVAILRAQKGRVLCSR